MSNEKALERQKIEKQWKEERAFEAERITCAKDMQKSMNKPMAETWGGERKYEERKMSIQTS